VATVSLDDSIQDVIEPFPENCWHWLWNTS